VDAVSVFVTPLRDRIEKIVPRANELIADTAVRLGLPRP
jgi:hypothetical protein